jgi:hypothetical protein
MQIKVNGRTVEVFAGARVRDVVRKYSRDEWALVKSGRKAVTDGRGHEVGWDGELSGGEELFLKPAAPAEPRA